MDVNFEIHWQVPSGLSLPQPRYEKLPPKYSSLALIMTISRCHQGTKNGSSRYTAIEACSKAVISCMKYQNRGRFLNNTRRYKDGEREKPASTRVKGRATFRNVARIVPPLLLTKKRACSLEKSRKLARMLQKPRYYTLYFTTFVPNLNVLLWESYKCDEAKSASLSFNTSRDTIERKVRNYGQSSNLADIRELVITRLLYAW